MTKKKLRYQEIEINTNDAALRKRIIERYQAIHDTAWFWDPETKDTRQGPPPEKQVVDYFEKEILDLLILNGVAENDMIVAQSRSIAKEMKISRDDLIKWYSKAWRRVKKLIKN